MAITRSQIARQLLQFGGGADAGGLGSPGGGTFGAASKSPNAGGDTKRSRIQEEKQADFEAKTRRQNVDAMRESLRKSISPTFGDRVGSFIKGGGVLGGLLRNFIKSTPEIFSDFMGSKTLKQFIDKRKQRKIDALSEEDEDSDEDKQLNVITKLIEDQGLMEVPSAVIDQGLMEAPGDNLNLDEGLMVAPGSIIDQGLITAPSSLGFTLPDDIREGSQEGRAGFADDPERYTGLEALRERNILEENMLGIPSNSLERDFPGMSVGDIIDSMNSGQRVNRFSAMGGGIMDLNTVRQMMFIGGIAKAAKKAVKKATRAVKSIAKSPLGKAALLGLATVPFGGPAGAFQSFKSANPLTRKLIIGGILTGAPFVFGSDEDENEIILPENLGPELTPAQLAAIQSKPFGTLTPRIAGSQFVAEGGRIGYQEGSKEPVAKKTMPLLEMGGKEMDLRNNGGFVPIGRMEKADDVPARLSKNEFVFTADAVRNAGDGDVDKGAEVMYNMMKNLEAGGDVSEESQGLKGARRMFQTSQRLEEVL